MPLCTHAGGAAQYWDLKGPNPIANVELPERCYTMDVQYPLMVIGTAERHIVIINLSNPTTIFKVRASASFHFLMVIPYILFSDSRFASQMANKDSCMFPCWKRVRCR
jgi:hypothetical protein